ncbi:anti-sigma-F factor Fin family protein [Niallia sp. 01092]|uniref:anti-sigma-F factor Fin family protein n=1 Tax=unclassified Niallia TaxID=2837522 RepID=UPI003FD056A4
MAIHYHCRHCGVKIGTIDSKTVETNQLGLHVLTEEDRSEMITYSTNGEVFIKSICEDCQESLMKNPHYYENNYLLH